MIIQAKTIIGSKIISQSGCNLGKVVDFEINATTQSIIKYYTQGELLGFLKEPLIINADQVIEIKPNEIIVKDAVVPEKIAEEISPDYKPS